MSVSKEFCDFVLDQLDQLESVVAKRMFGGVGLYSEGFFFAIISDDTLYLKVDDSNRPDFEKAGMAPFRPFPNKSTALQYYEVPIDVLEDRDLLASWARKAIAVAKIAQTGNRRR
jgi:DNA transformation protein